MAANEYLDRLRSIGFSKGVSRPREQRVGDTKQTVERTPTSTVIHTEHPDGRVDGQVTPDTIRYGARVHGSGKKKGTVAEVREMTKKERFESHGQS